jgi:glycosyltransferase involved in cell wall biosynthesis
VLAEHDALVFPSTYEGEGLPGIVVEALQAGLPVIATRWRALPELVSNEQSGLLVPPRSPIALAAAMARLTLDDALFAELRVGAAERGRELDASNWQRRLEGWLLNVCGRTADRVSAASNYREVSP